MHHVNKGQKVRNNMVISIDMEEACDKNQHVLMIKKILRKTGTEGHFLSFIKSSYKNPTVNIILTGERLIAFYLKSKTKLGWSLSPVLFKIVLEILASATRQGNEMKFMQVQKEEKKEIK